jgi:ABC-type multidrug transport system fused ATPase/permease subunit
MAIRKWYLIATLLFVGLVYQLFVFSVLFEVIDVQILAMLTAEGALIETVGAAAFFVGAVFWGIAWLRSGQLNNRSRYTTFKRLCYVVLMLLFVVAAGEEISWGQRLFHIAAPEYIQEINVQEEFTLHNMQFWGIDMAHLTRRVFNVAWFTFLVIIPVLCAIHEPLRLRIAQWIPLFPWWMSLPFLFNYAFLRVLFLVTALLQRQSFNRGINEIQETNFAVLFLVLALYTNFVELNVLADATAE